MHSAFTFDHLSHSELSTSIASCVLLTPPNCCSRRSTSRCNFSCWHTKLSCWTLPKNSSSWYRARNVGLSKSDAACSSSAIASLYVSDSNFTPTAWRYALRSLMSFVASLLYTTNAALDLGFLNRLMYHTWSVYLLGWVLLINVDLLRCRVHLPLFLDGAFDVPLLSGSLTFLPF